MACQAHKNLWHGPKTLNLELNTIHVSASQQLVSYSDLYTVLPVLALLLRLHFLTQRFTRAAVAWVLFNQSLLDSVPLQVDTRISARPSYGITLELQ